MMAGQTINDRLLAARHSIAGQGLAKSVCKATTEEMIAPKKKHLDCEYYYLLLLNYHLRLFSRYQTVTLVNKIHDFPLYAVIFDIEFSGR